MLETFALILCFLMIGYGYIRYLIAIRKRETHPAVHAIWMPLAAFVYATALAVTTWIF